MRVVITEIASGCMTRVTHGIDVKDLNEARSEAMATARFVGSTIGIYRSNEKLDTFNGDYWEGEANAVLTGCVVYWPHDDSFSVTPVSRDTLAHCTSCMYVQDLKVTVDVSGFEKPDRTPVMGDFGAQG